jgi:hypothetical protein
LEHALSRTIRKAIWLILTPLCVVAVLGLLACWGITSFLKGPTPNNTPAQLARIETPHPANALAWSADGQFLAAGAWGWGPGDKEPDPSEVYVVDVAKGSVTATGKADGMLQVLAFSPDGKYLAVGTIQSNWHPASPRGGVMPELVVFDLPAMTAKFTAKSTQGNGFSDLAWAADSKVLYAIDSPEAVKDKKAAVRRWAVSGFTDQFALTAPQVYQYEAITVSQDGDTLAIADAGQGADGKARLIRLLDIAKSTERASSRATQAGNYPPRMGFSPDGRAVGVMDAGKLEWWDAVTGKPSMAAGARFALQPASLNGLAGGIDMLSLDGSLRAEAYRKNRDFGDIGRAFDGREKENGAFIRLTDSATKKSTTWRIEGDTPGGGVLCGRHEAGEHRQPTEFGRNLGRAEITAACPRNCYRGIELLSWTGLTTRGGAEGPMAAPAFTPPRSPPARKPAAHPTCTRAKLAKTTTKIKVRMTILLCLHAASGAANALRRCNANASFWAAIHKRSGGKPRAVSLCWG